MFPYPIASARQFGFPIGGKWGRVHIDGAEISGYNNKIVRSNSRLIRAYRRELCEVFYRLLNFQFRTHRPRLRLPCAAGACQPISPRRNP